MLLRICLSCFVILFTLFFIMLYCSFFIFIIDVCFLSIHLFLVIHLYEDLIFIVFSFCYFILYVLSIVISLPLILYISVFVTKITFQPEYVFDRFLIFRYSTFIFICLINSFLHLTITFA